MSPLVYASWTWDKIVYQQSWDLRSGRHIGGIKYVWKISFTIIITNIYGSFLKLIEFLRILSHTEWCKAGCVIIFLYHPPRPIRKIIAISSLIVVFHFSNFMHFMHCLEICQSSPNNISVCNERFVWSKEKMKQMRAWDPFSFLPNIFELVSSLTLYGQMI